MRLRIFGFAIAIIFSFLFLRLLDFQVVRSVEYRQMSKKNCIRLLPQRGSRGRILDRNNAVIADNTLSYDCMLLPQATDDVNQTLRRVASIVGTGFSEVKKQYRQDYVSTSIPVTVVKNLDIQKAIALEELKLDLPGVMVEPHPLRFYPHGRTAAHVLGYLSQIDHWRLTKLEDYGYKTKDIVGFGGVEERYDYFLREEDGGTSVEVDRKGTIVRIVGFQPPRNGKDIQLTIDLRLQKIAEECLEDNKGGVVMMDPATGELLAVASYPTFDPSAFIKQDSPSISALFNDPQAPLLNRAISGGGYPPGSIFKVIVATAGLETGKIDESTSYVCTGELMVGGQRFGCWSTHDQQDLTGALAHSCNVFFYRSGLLIGANAIHDYAAKFGLGKTSIADLPYEGAGNVPSPLWKKLTRFKNWYNGDTVNFSIGQGDLLVTPLQMVRMMAVFANGGRLVTPYIARAIDEKDITGYQRKSVAMPLSSDTLARVKKGLRSVVTFPKGTGNVLADVPVSVAGKTGTAQQAGGLSHAWFVGYFPFEKPQYVIGVLLERGGPGHNACVIARRIIKRMAEEGII